MTQTDSEQRDGTSKDSACDLGDASFCNSCGSPSTLELWRLATRKEISDYLGFEGIKKQDNVQRYCGDAIVGAGLKGVAAFIAANIINLGHPVLANVAAGLYTIGGILESGYLESFAEQYNAFTHRTK